MAHALPYYTSVRITPSDCKADLPALLLPRLPLDSIPGMHFPHMSPQFCYLAVQESQPVVHRLRLSPSPLGPDLPRADQLLLWKPWIFGREDSHSLSLLIPAFSLPRRSTAPLRYRFFVSSMLLYRWYCYHPTASVLCFSPGHFRRRTSRLVSYYALF